MLSRVALTKYRVHEHSRAALSISGPLGRAVLAFPHPTFHRQRQADDPALNERMRLSYLLLSMQTWEGCSPAEFVLWENRTLLRNTGM